MGFRDPILGVKQGAYVVRVQNRTKIEVQGLLGIAYQRLALPRNFEDTRTNFYSIKQDLSEQEKFSNYSLNALKDAWITIDEAKQLADMFGMYKELKSLWEIGELSVNVFIRQLTCADCGFTV
jgi:predicted alpha/beta hydrolase family esterase